MDIDKTANHLNRLKDWKLDARVKEKLKDTGFDRLLGVTEFPVKHSLPLLSAVLEGYDAEHRCFKFNNHKLVLGLEDIVYITGLPIDGKPVTGIHPMGQQLSRKYLGSFSSNDKATSSTSFVWLKRKFEIVPENIAIDSPEILPYVRAFLLYLIGSIVVPDSYGTVPLMFLSLMETIEGIKEYAWGAAMLAHLHVSLGIYKQEYSPDRKNILKGHSYALMVFALERIPKLVLTVCSGVDRMTNYLPTSFPLFEGWTKLLQDCAENVEGEITKQDYLQVLEKLQENDIVWQPYQRLPCDFLPQYCAGQQKIGMSRTILLCFEKAVYHRPDESPKQFGIQNVDTRKLRSIIELECKRRTCKKVDWSNNQTYGLYKEEWENRYSCIIEERCFSFAEHASSSRAPNDSDLLSAKRKRVDHVGHEHTVKMEITTGNNAVKLESHMEQFPRPLKLVHTAPAAAPSPSFEFIYVSSEDEEDDTGCEDGSLDHLLLCLPDYSATEPSSCLGASASQSAPPLAPPRVINSSQQTVNQNSSTYQASTSIGVPLTQSAPPQAPPQVSSIENEYDDVLNVLDELKDLLKCDSSTSSDQPSTVDDVDSAKETIRYILRQGLDVLRNSTEVRTAFLAASDFLLSAAAFSSDSKATLKELQNHASTFLEVEDIPTAAEVVSQKKFLKEQQVKVPAVLEQVRRADKKVASLRAKLDTVCEKQDKMKEAVTIFMNKIQDAEKKVATRELVSKCYASWSELGTRLSSDM